MCGEILWNYLKRHCRGSRRAKTGTELARQLEISRNELQREVNLLRRQRRPVGSSRAGYFYPTTAGEVYSTIQYLRKIDAGLQAGIQGMEASMESFRPQGGGNGRQI